MKWNTSIHAVSLTSDPSSPEHSKAAMTKKTCMVAITAFDLYLSPKLWDSFNLNHLPLEGENLKGHENLCFLIPSCKLYVPYLKSDNPAPRPTLQCGDLGWWKLMFWALKLGLCLLGNVTHQGLQTQMPTGTKKGCKWVDEGMQSGKAAAREWMPRGKGREPIASSSQVSHTEWKTSIVKSDFWEKNPKLYINSPNCKWSWLIQMIRPNKISLKEDSA